MSAHSRRSFLTTSAGLAAGATFVATQRGAAAAGLAPTNGAPPANDPSGTVADMAPIDTAGLGGAVLYIRDAASGAVVLMDEQGEQAFVDPSLVDAIARAAGTKG